MSLRQFYWNGLHVPFISPWSGETVLPGTIVRGRSIGGEGIGYQDEDSRVDRKAGVLWVRYSAVRGVGQPLLARVHALRQRQAMNRMLCQVCGRSTVGRHDERHLFLVRAATGQPVGKFPGCLNARHPPL